MSLTKRKKRPLTRDTSSFRDDRLFIVACDDTYAPKQYFDFFKLSREQVHIVPTQDCKSSAVHVLKRLLEFEHEEDDELWMLLDKPSDPSFRLLQSLFSGGGSCRISRRHALLGRDRSSCA